MLLYDLPTALTLPPRLRFDYAPLGSLHRTAGGAVTFNEMVGGSLWEMALESRPLIRSDYDIVHAWFLALRGGRNYGIRAYDFHRCRPLAYPVSLPATRHGGAAFDGTCTVTAVAGETISLSNLPSAYKVTVGDYVSFPYQGGQVLVKALETRIAINGVIANLYVGPWLRAGGTLPATATLVKAWCAMRPKPGSWSGERSAGPSPVSFEAIQSLI